MFAPLAPGDCCDSSNSSASGDRREAHDAAPCVEEQQSEAALPLPRMRPSGDDVNSSNHCHSSLVEPADHCVGTRKVPP